MARARCDRRVRAQVVVDLEQRRRRARRRRSSRRASASDRDDGLLAQDVHTRRRRGDGRRRMGRVGRAHGHRVDVRAAPAAPSTSANVRVDAPLARRVARAPPGSVSAIADDLGAGRAVALDVVPRDVAGADDAHAQRRPGGRGQRSSWPMALAGSRAGACSSAAYRRSVTPPGRPAAGVGDDAQDVRVVVGRVRLVARLEVDDAPSAPGPGAQAPEHLAAREPADHQQLVGLRDVERARRTSPPRPAPPSRRCPPARGGPAAGSRAARARRPPATAGCRSCPSAAGRCATSGPSGAPRGPCRPAPRAGPGPPPRRSPGRGPRGPTTRAYRSRRAPPSVRPCSGSSSVAVRTASVAQRARCRRRSRGGCRRDRWLRRARRVRSWTCSFQIVTRVGSHAPTIRQRTGERRI